jgi:hypothetical protein
MAKKPKKHIYLPNEIFENFQKNIEKSQHISFLYAYYYFISYLYRYCEYEGMTQSIIKERLGYNPKEKRLDYLIKKDGELDKMGYTKTTTNYPLSWHMDSDNIIHFKTIEDFKKENHTHIISDRNFKVKYPIKMFHRFEESVAERVLDGTLYDASNTHKIEYDIFELCMDKEELGVTAFYIYGWLRHMTNIFGNYTASGRKLSLELRMSEPTLFKYTKALETNKLLKIEHKKFIGEDGEANRYRALTR